MQLQVPLHHTSNPIVDKAREYLDTPFHLHGRLKGVGIDCVGLVICVGIELGYLDTSLLNITGYSVNTDSALLVENLIKYTNPVSFKDMGPGNIVCLKFLDMPQHIGIIGNYRHGGISIIHAANKHKKVVETRLMFTDKTKFVSAHEFPERL